MATVELRPGQRFRGLLIHSLLRKGSMGCAYLGSHPVLKMPFVVKTFSAEDEDPFHEAHLAARVSSHHVVRVVDAGFENDMPFVIQSYVDGVDLRELLSRLRAMNRVLPLHMVIPTLVEIAHGLHAIHMAGVVHRDIKPGNLFLCGDGHALIGDFGVASDGPSLSGGASSFAGTPLFIAPEVWRSEAVDGRADIYSLGATAHLLATGNPPFSGTVNDLARAHNTEQYEPPATRRPTAAYLFTLIASMLGKRPDHRPRSAEQVARLLERIVPERPSLSFTSPTTAEIAGLYIELYRGDITSAEADVIVSSANWQMNMKAGVAEAIRRAGGDEIQEEAMRSAPAAMGDVIWTGAGHLRGCWVAHAVAALAGAVCIQRCVLRVLLEAQARGAKSVVFPALGTGVGEVPASLAAKLTLEAIVTFARLGPTSIDQISIVLLDSEALESWSMVLRSMTLVPGR